MAQQATLHRFQIELSDVDRALYEHLELRVARHPSETARYLLTRTLAYCLSYEPGIAFSKGGLSARDVPALTICDPTTGTLQAWIDVGSPSAERLHKAAKLAPRVLLYTTEPLTDLRREAPAIHRAAEIQVWWLEPRLLAELEAKLERSSSFELVRSDGQLYVTMGAAQLSGAVERRSLVEAGS